MGKSRRGHKELSREQELKYENQKLRREISSLRKQLARIDLDRYTHVREIVEEHLHQEEQVDASKLLESLKKEWKCHHCRDGYLEIIVYSKMGTPWYKRECNNCDHRTKAKQYDPDTVKGIKKQTEINENSENKDKIKTFKR